MKKQILGLISTMVLVTTITLAFTGCETDLNKLDQAQVLEMSAGAGFTEMGGVNAEQLCTCLATNYPVEDLSAEETNALLFMREEEKLARDIYLGMYDLWKVRIFQNISKSEQRHMDAIGCLLQKYELSDPVGANGIGVFQNADLQALYNNLLTQGTNSLQDAYTVGATIEDVDIRDLMLHSDDPAVDNQDLLAVFGELTKASRNHMRAFTGRLEALGVTYTPQYITPEYFETIVTTDWEKGGSICGPCPGQGLGNGPGNGGNCPYGNNGNGGGNGPGNGNGGNCPYGNNGNGPGNGNGNGPGNGNGGNCPYGNTGNGGGNGNGGGGNGNGGK